MSDRDTLFADIDLGQLPRPTVIEAASAEALLEAARGDLLARAPELRHVLEAEGQVLSKLLEAQAYRAARLVAQANAQAQGTLLAFAWGGTLDHIAALFGVERQVLDPGDPTDPARPRVLETDEELRRRVKLAPEAFSVAGVRGAWIFHGLQADPRVHDVSVDSPVPGEVRVTVLARDGDGSALPPLVEAVQVYLSDDARRPVGAWVTTRSAEILPYRVRAVLDCHNGPDAGLVEAAAHTAVEAYVEAQHGLGRASTISGLHRALHQPGVRNVRLESPAVDVIATGAQAPWCSGIDIRRA